MAGASGAATGAAEPDRRVDVDEAARLAFSRREGDTRRRSPDESAGRRSSSDERAGRRGPGATTARAPAGGDVADPWSGHARLTRGTLDDAVLRIGVRPSRLPGVLTGLPARSITAGLGAGVATVALPPDPSVVAAAHAAVHAARGTSVLRSRPPGLDAPAWGPPPSAIGLLRAVKQELDPAGRLGPGRLAPWLTERTP
jgi:glycolate oxidase FAD binding subunit